MTRSSRVKKGFFRLGLIGLVPSILCAFGVIVFQILWPSGSIHATLMPAKLLNISGRGVRDVAYNDADTLSAGLDTERGQDFQLIDGRTFRVMAADAKSDEDFLKLNSDIVRFEMNRGYPINWYSDVFAADGFVFKCKSDCFLLFPNQNYSHFGRSMDWVIPLMFLIGGIFWSGIIWIIGWLIRGFMTE